MRLFGWFRKPAPSKEMVEGIVDVIRHSAPRFPKRTAIVCPKCAKVIAVAKRDIMGGETMRSDAWHGEFIKPYGKLICPDDGTLYIKRGENKTLLHTQRGWI